MMLKHIRYLQAALILALTALAAGPAMAASAIDRDSQAALDSLYASSPGAKALGEKAKGILVFPSVTTAGLGLVGQKISKKK